MKDFSVISAQKQQLRVKNRNKLPRMVYIAGRVIDPLQKQLSDMFSTAVERKATHISGHVSQLNTEFELFPSSRHPEDKQEHT